MKYAKERVNIICEQLKRLITVRSVNISEWQCKKGCYITPEEAEKAEETWSEFDCGTKRWYGPDQHYWFRTKTVIPKEMAGRQVWLHVRTQLEDWDDGRNPQFLTFINGVPTQGLDINHRELLITEHAIGGEELVLDLQAYTGTLHNEFRLLTDIEDRDPDITSLYYDIQVPLWGLNRMEENDRAKWQIETVLNDTINLIDLRQPYSKEFYSSIKEAQKYIAKAMYEDLAGNKDIIATCIGHTHIDVAWLWTVAQVRQKSCRSFATVLKFMEEYPEYKFMSSQPQLYEFVKERHPDLYAMIKQRVAEGRWEPEGGMWVEADCNLTSGESLVRQFLFGKRFFKEEFGVDNKILWLPDVFGYNGALPQIMKKCGIDYFMTTKLAWNQFNKIPADTFQWEGIDGTKVFTHLITTLGVGQKVSNYFTTYNGMLHPDSIMGGWERYQNKEINNDILVSFGYGDGGGGPTRTMLETSKRMEKGIKGIPKVRQEFAGTYFRELEARVKDNRRLPTWVGELYFEYHRGTLTSMGRNKRANRKSEYLMMELELLSVLTKNQLNYPNEELNAMWKVMLRNQFHDILPGSSIKEVYEVTKQEYEQINKQGEQLLSDRLHLLTDKKDGVTIVNTLGFERSDIVNLGNLKADAITDGTNIYTVQQTNDGAVAFIKGMPSKGYAGYDICAATKKESPFTVTKQGIESPFYKIQINECGQFSSIYDKAADRELLLTGKCGNELIIYEDKPMCFSNWDIDIYYQEKHWTVDQLTGMEWTECGPVRATLALEYKVMDTVIRQKIHFYAENRRIDFETYVDWKFSEHLMKVHFPVDIHTDEATFDIQFGNVKRKIHQNTSWDVARFESCAQKWMDLSEGGYGVSLMNDCKYGHSAIDRSMAITLVKSGTEPNPETDREEHFITYSLYPHLGSWQEANTVQESFNLNVPARTLSGKPQGRYSLFNISKDNVVLETVKKAEDGDGIIVRLYETQNKRTKVILNSAVCMNEVIETNLIEENIDGTLCNNHNTKYEFIIKPYEIKTFRIR